MKITCSHATTNATISVCMKMTSRRGSRMISKAERRLERHRRDYMGRVHVYTHVRTRSPEYFHLFVSLPIFACIHSRPLPSAISFSPSPNMTSARRAQFTSTPRPIICCFRSEGLFSTRWHSRTRYSDLLYEAIGNAIFISRLHRDVFIEKTHFFIFYFIFLFIADFGFKYLLLLLLLLNLEFDPVYTI